MSERQVEVEHRVTPLELFLDLVFVFAFTQVTTLLLGDPTWAGLARGLLVLAVLWWTWSSYSWLTNMVDTNAGLVIAAILAAIAAMFVVAIAVPDAFGRDRIVFALALVVVLLVHLALYVIAARGERDLLRAVLRLAITNLAGGVLILLAAFVPGVVRLLLWSVALVIGMFGPLFGGTSGWRVGAAHFAERHALIVIIALGESLAAIGFGARSTTLGPPWSLPPRAGGGRVFLARVLRFFLDPRAAAPNEPPWSGARRLRA